MRWTFVLVFLFIPSALASDGDVDLSKITVERGLYTYILDGDIATAADILPQGIIGHTIIRENRISLAMHREKKEKPGFFPERVSYSAHGRVKIDKPGGYVFAVRAHSPPLTFNCANCDWSKNRRVVKNAFVDCSFEMTFVNSETKKSEKVLVMETSGSVGKRYAVGNLKHPTIEKPGCAHVDQTTMSYDLEKGQYHIHYHITCPGVRNFANPVDEFEEGPYVDECGLVVPTTAFDTWPGDEVVWELFMKEPGEYNPKPFIPNEHHRITQWD